MDLVSRISEVVTAIGTAIKGKQDKLVSGNNIATINNQSLLNGGNINISGGVGGGIQNVYIQQTEPEIDVGTSALWIEKKADGNISVWIKDN